MINLTNIKRYDNLPFEEYQQLPGYSHSFLKREDLGVEPEFRVTRKVQLGKLVDGILTDPDSVNMRDPLYNTSLKIARYLKDNFGFMISKFQKQVSFTADMEYEGIVMPARFRPDWIVADYCIVDLKVTSEKDLRGMIRHMKYDNQLYGYKRAAKVPKAYILGYSIPLERADLIDLQLDVLENCCKEDPDKFGPYRFWKDSIMRFGRVAV